MKKVKRKIPVAALIVVISCIIFFAYKSVTITRRIDANFEKIDSIYNTDSTPVTHNPINPIWDLDSANVYSCVLIQNK